jgi:chitinase
VSSRDSGTKQRRRARRFSLLRLVAVLLVAAGACAAVVAAAQQVVRVTKTSGPGPWYAPYVDATLTPQTHFEDLSANPSNDVVLAFVVASRAGDCVPTWGTYFSPDGAGSALDLDRRIARLRQRGGDLIVSFGGAANDELARHCDEAGLLRAYTSVIDRYKLTTVDFDIEGLSLTDSAANSRRARVVKTLQANAAADGRHLAVWLTVPVAPSGMSAEALDVTGTMLEGGVDLAGVNLMTMDYGASRSSDRDMVDATADALNASWRQLDGAYRRAGMRLDPKELWRKLGMTPMIGQNDTPGDRVTVADARRLLALARKLGLGRVSIWSLNRDTACGAQFDLGTVSNLCSGVEQKPLAFTEVFDQLRGRAADAAGRKTVTTATDPRDDPATSPYPIWSDAKVYTVGDKVTWHRDVYEAKWWSHANVPDAPVVHEWDTPWRYLGPVMPGDKPAPKLRAGTYPTWSAVHAYIKGDRVQIGTTVYEAKWWTRGERPNADVGQPWDSPWEELDPGKLKRR